MQFPPHHPSPFGEGLGVRFLTLFTFLVVSLSLSAQVEMPNDSAQAPADSGKTTLDSLQFYNNSNQVSQDSAQTDSVFNESKPIVVADSNAVDSTLADISEAFEPEPNRQQQRLQRRLADTARHGVHRPGRAALWGLIPGGGQVYNGKFWKLPIVYGGLGAGIYAITFNHDQYRIYLDAFFEQTDTNFVGIPAFTGTYGPAQLITLQNEFRKQRDLSIILTALGYGLTILDAYVDAHLFYYDVSDDLSLRWEPRFSRDRFSGGTNFGISLTLSLK